MIKLSGSKFASKVICLDIGHGEYCGKAILLFLLIFLSVSKNCKKLNNNVILSIIYKCLRLNTRGIHFSQNKRFALYIKKKPCRGYMIGYKSSMLLGYYVS